MTSAPMNPAEKLAREALAAWEKAAQAMAETMVRDPRTLEVGASWLRLGLEWKKACDEIIAASLPRPPR